MLAHLHYKHKALEKSANNILLWKRERESNCCCCVCVDKIVPVMNDSVTLHLLVPVSVQYYCYCSRFGMMRRKVWLSSMKCSDLRSSAYLIYLSRVIAFVILSIGGLTNQTKTWQRLAAPFCFSKFSFTNYSVQTPNCNGIMPKTWAYSGCNAL